MACQQCDPAPDLGKEIVKGQRVFVRRFSEAADSGRAIRSHRQHPKAVAVSEGEMGVHLTIFLPEFPDAEILFPDINVVEKNDTAGLSMGRHISKSCRTASYVW